MPLATQRRGGFAAFLLWLGALAVGVVGLVYGGEISRVPSAWAYLGLWVVCALGCLVFVILRVPFSLQRIGALDPLEIPVYVTLTNLGLIGIAGIAPYADPALLILPDTTTLPNSLLLIGVGLWAMWGGYALLSLTWERGGAVALSNHPTRFAVPSQRRTLFLYGGVLILRLALFASGTGERFRVGGGLSLFGEWDQWFTYLRATAWVTLAVILLQGMSKRDRYSFRVISLIIGIEVVMGVFAGWASHLIKLAALILGCMVYTRQPTRRIALATLIGICGTVALTPVARFMRGGDQDLDALWQGIQIIAEGDAADSTWALFIRRQSTTAQTPALIMAKTPYPVAFRPLEELLLSPFSFIPRVIWRGKPEYANIGGILTEQYFGVSAKNGSSAVTFAGNLYLYGGVGVVILGMAAFGVLAALIYRMFAVPGLAHGQIGLLAAYAGVAIHNLHLGEGDILGTIQGLIQASVFFYVVAVWLCPRRAF
ncbi:MAG TPA: hypothetical protein PLD47_04445 [Aggregatilineales bacterium]|nr:hypothetical protein [Anaerolineales bacterium]HRE46952.1 hypothetical protein [Aggregatilineales bacterium]